MDKRSSHSKWGSINAVQSALQLSITGAIDPLYSGRGANLWAKIEADNAYLKWGGQVEFDHALSQLTLRAFGASREKFTALVSLGCGSGVTDTRVINLLANTQVLKKPVSYFPVDSSPELVARSAKAVGGSGLSVVVGDKIVSDMACFPAYALQDVKGRKLIWILGNFFWKKLSGLINLQL